jgi:hypothetical protein
MTLTRDQMILVVLKSRSQAYKDEITHQLGVDREYAYDEVTAAFDAEDRAETWVQEGNVEARPLLKAARQALIDIGFYRSMPGQEIDNTYTSTGGSPWAFKLAGIPYTHDEPAEGWMFPDQLGDGQERIA